MALCDTIVKQVIVESDKDVFYEIFRYKPHQISEISPSFIKQVTCHDGEWGALGSVFVFKYIHDEEEKVAKEVIEQIDEEKKYICYKVIEGDLLKDYKTFANAIRVDTNGQHNMVTWAFKYEKLNANVDDPNSLADLCINMTKDIDNHHLAKSKKI